MSPFFDLKNLQPMLVLILASLTFAACDSNSDSDEVRVSILIEGNGTGSVSSRTSFLDIDCDVNEGEITGTCEDVFISEEERGTIRLVVSPSPTTDFEWGSPCKSSETGLCEIDFDTGDLQHIEVTTVFEAKTKKVVMDRSSPNITMPGEDGAIFVTAQAVTDDGAPVNGVVYTWEVDRPDVVNIIPQSDPRRVKVTANINGVAVISATAQGVTGETAIEVEFSN